MAALATRTETQWDDIVASAIGKTKHLFLLVAALCGLEGYAQGVGGRGARPPARPKTPAPKTPAPKTIRKMLLWGFIGLGFLGLIAILPAVQSVGTIIIVAWFLAFLLEPVVNFIENRGVNRVVATSRSFAAIFFCGGIGFKYRAPVVSKEIQGLSKGLSEGESGSVSTDISTKLANAIPALANPMIQEEIRTKIDSLMRKSFTVVG